jgi:hypothetical protein
MKYKICFYVILCILCNNLAQARDLCFSFDFPSETKNKDKPTQVQNVSSQIDQTPEEKFQDNLKISAVRILQFNNMPITHLDFLSYLTVKETLTVLDITACVNLKDTQYDAIKNASCLEALRLYAPQTANISFVVDLKKLIAIEILRGYSVHDFSPLTKLFGLKRVNFENTPIDEKVLETVLQNNSKTLRYVNIEGTKVSKEVYLRNFALISRILAFYSDITVDINTINKLLREYHPL